MDSGTQSQPSQSRAQANGNASRFNWGNGGIMNPSTGNIWLNNNNNLASRDTTGTINSAQRTQGIGPPDSSPWTRPGASTWNSTDTQQFRPSGSRSTSPKNALQNASNTSPSFNSNRAANIQNATFSTSNLMSSFAPAQNASTNYSNYTENTQADNGNAFQQGYVGIQRGLASAFDDGLPGSRHSESGTPLQFGTETSGFVGLSSHSRHASRMSHSGPSTSFAPQQPSSRSQSFNPANEQAQAAVEAARANLFSNRIQTSSPGPRAGAAQASTPAPSQFGTWRDFTPGNAFANGSLQDVRRDSLAHSVQHSTMNSPRTFGAPRQADPWTPAQVPVDMETLNRLQRSQGQMSRQATQSPYLESAYNPYGEIPAQLLQQIQPTFSLPYQGYNFQLGQHFFPPAGPAGMMPRGGRPQDLTVGIRCQELEEFRRSSKSNRKWELKNVFGRVVEFAGDQQGSRFLQEKIPTANSDDRQRVFDEIMVDANALMVDVFGNYVVQQLFEHGTMVQKKLLAGKMKGHVVQLSTQLYGCRCVQEALEYVLVGQQVELAEELRPEIIRVMKSDNGNHVVQKLLTKLPRDKIDFVYEAVRGRVFELSQQQYACRVIQRMIERGSEADKAFLLQEFHDVAARLVTDSWGNYVVQAVIRQGGREARAKVIRLCIDQFLVFSKQKVASNVMEHCIEYGTEEDRLEMYRLITRRADDGSNMLQVMWKDNFANYVVQKLCHCLKGAEQSALVKESRPYFEARKKPSRPDDKWLAFEKLINQFSAPPSRQGSVSSVGAGPDGVVVSRTHSQSGSAMPTPDLTTGGNSPRTSSSQDTNEASLDQSERYLVDQFSKANLRDIVEQRMA